MGFVLLCSVAMAQHKELLKGTNAYQEGQYETATLNFLQALAEDETSVKSNFNLANAYYKTKKYEEAAVHYQDVISSSDDDLIQSKAFYNLGNSYLSRAKNENSQSGAGEESQEHLKNAIEAYKNALRKNAEDFDAKNNLGVAYKMLRQQQQQQQQQNQENKQQEDKPQEENKDKEKEEEQNQNGDQQPPEQDKEDPIKNQNDLEKGKPQDLEKDQIERMLQRMEEEDKKVQEKLRRRKRSDRVNIEKDW